MQASLFTTVSIAATLAIGDVAILAWNSILTLKTSTVIKSRCNFHNHSRSIANAPPSKIWNTLSSSASRTHVAPSSALLSTRCCIRFCRPEKRNPSKRYCNNFQLDVHLLRPVLSMEKFLLTCCRQQNSLCEAVDIHESFLSCLQTGPLSRR